MSKVKARMSYEQAYNLANMVAAKLRPYCHRVEIAGSIRRREASIGDIELVAIPTKNIQRGLFKGVYTERYPIAEYLRSLSQVRLLKDGDKYKQLVFRTLKGCGVTVDLYLQIDPATWGVNYMIRTGSAEFAKRMVTRQSKKGFMPDRYRMSHARVFDVEIGDFVNTKEEEDLFVLWGMSYRRPWERKL